MFCQNLCFGCVFNLLGLFIYWRKTIPRLHAEKCVLPKFVFWVCFQSVGPVHLHRRENIPRLHAEKLSRNCWFKKNMESCQNHFFSARSALPPPIFVFLWYLWKFEDHSFLHVLLVWGVTLTNLLIKKHQSWAFVLRYYFLRNHQKKIRTMVAII